MDCCKCGQVMDEQIRRIKLLRPFSKSETACKTALRRVYHCKFCDVYFGLTMKLVEVELA